MSDNNSNKKTILVVDDEKPIIDILVYNLQKEGYDTLEATDGEMGLNLALEKKPNLILLDVMLPKMDGLTVCKRVKQAYNVPILMLSARGDEIDKIIGLELGADDYITKPFSMRELMARVKAVLKRTNNIENTDYLEFGDISLDLKNAKLKSGENEIQLSGKELEIMEQLLLNKNQILSRESLLERIWGYDSDAEYNNIEVYITFIRRKLKLIESKVGIKAVRGIGYKLEKMEGKNKNDK